MTSGEIIKTLREREGINQAELARQLGISRSSISMYESNTRVPTAEMYQILADFFNVDVDYLMGRSIKTTVLPERIAYENRKRKQAVAPKSALRKRIDNTLDRLNDDGQEIVANTADGLDKSGQYKRTPSPSKVMEMPESYFVNKEDIEDKHINHGAAAGRINHGVYNGQIDEDDIMLKKSDERPRFDDLITAKGHSMEPEIHDGDGLFVRWQPVADTGDIVIASYQEEVFVKKYIERDNRNVILRSFNPDYDDIEICLEDLDFPDEFKIIGVVVDWETPIKQEQLI